MRKRWIWFLPLGILAFVVFVTVGGFVVQLLWNWLLPPLFGLREVTFWQALGLLALCRILFGGFGKGIGPRPWRGRHMKDRWHHMTPEERERFKQGMRGRWVFDDSPGETKS